MTLKLGSTKIICRELKLKRVLIVGELISALRLRYMYDLRTAKYQVSIGCDAPRSVIIGYQAGEEITSNPRLPISLWPPPFHIYSFDIIQLNAASRAESGIP